MGSDRRYAFPAVLPPGKVARHGVPSVSVVSSPEPIPGGLFPPLVGLDRLQGIHPAGTVTWNCDRQDTHRSSGMSADPAINESTCSLRKAARRDNPKYRTSQSNASIRLCVHSPRRRGAAGVSAQPGNEYDQSKALSRPRGAKRRARSAGKANRQVNACYAVDLVVRDSLHVRGPGCSA